MIARNILIQVGAVALLLAIVATGCSSSSSTGDGSTQSEAPPAAGAAPTVEQAREAGAIARAIENEPNRMSEILSAHGMTAESLEDLMFEIAKDPKLTEAYEAAKRSPSSG
ncbi:MAG TPA: hypothetical protein VFP58_08285 [Candidatus Eisenbacteria bacterium]|nr:hypothetical protein [Candidatus Eisenbacteria bacterium]